MDYTIAKKYFPEISSEQREQFTALYDLYAEWNAKINVVSRKDFDQLYLRHILHSLAIAKVCRFEAGARVLDVGCGSGILSVASLLLGADSAVGVDIDALAVKTAKENGVTNGLTNRSSPCSKVQQPIK
mgnify:CR=1 FL=1